MKKILAFAAVAASAALAAPASLLAAPINCPGTAATTDREFTLNTTPSASCYAFGDGNIGNGRNDDFLNSSAGSGLTMIENDESNNNGGYLNVSGIDEGSGSFTLSSTIYSLYDSIYPGFKSGANMSPAWAVFSLVDGTTSGTFSLSRNGTSHVVVYGGGEITDPPPPNGQVPVPGSLALMSLGLFGVGLTRKFFGKKAA